MPKKLQPKLLIEKIRVMTLDTSDPCEYLKGFRCGCTIPDILNDHFVPFGQVRVETVILVSLSVLSQQRPGIFLEEAVAAAEEQGLQPIDLELGLAFRNHWGELGEKAIFPLDGRDSMMFLNPPSGKRIDFRPTQIHVAPEYKLVLK